jgi:ABC-type proline/glycine betaine transport system permease subunit
LRLIGFTTAAAISGALITYLTLPILPVATFATTSLPSQVPDSAEQIGWPQLVTTVESVIASLPADQR